MQRTKPPAASRLATLTLTTATLLLSGGSGQAVESWWLPQYYVPESLLFTDQSDGFRVGPVDLYPRVSASAVFDDNINISSNSGTRQSDLLWSLAPGISLAAGTRGGEGASLTLDYTPAFVFYTDHGQYDSIDQAAMIRGTWALSKLTLGLSQGMQIRSGGVAEAGQRAQQRTFNTQLTSRYELSEKSSFEVNGSQNITSYDDPKLYSSWQWSNDNWFNYQVLPKVTMGLGASLGYLEADNNPNQLFERVSLRGSYALASKVNVSAWVGGEWRQYDGDAPSTLEPVYNLSGTYTPRENTSLTLEGHRGDQNSAVLAGQNYIRTGFTAGISQRVLQKYFFHLTGGYDNLDYHATTQGTVATRQDGEYLVRFGVDTVLFRKLSTGVFYQWQDHVSNDGTYDYNSNQVGLVANYSF